MVLISGPNPIQDNHTWFEQPSSQKILFFIICNFANPITMYRKRSKIGKKARSSRGSESSKKVEERVISDENSDDSSVIVPVVNPARRFIISDSDEEENPRPDSSVDWNWKKSVNTIKIGNIPNSMV